MMTLLFVLIAFLLYGGSAFRLPLHPWMRSSRFHPKGTLGTLRTLTETVGASVRSVTADLLSPGQAMAANSAAERQAVKPFVVESDVVRVRWTPEEDEKLREGVQMYGRRKWTKISEALLPHKEPNACRHRWTLSLDPAVKIGPWTASEDARLKKLVGELGVKHGTRIWSKVAEHVLGRSREQCANRWRLAMAHQGKTKAAWSEEHDALLKKGVEELGTDGKWAAIAEGIPGKSGWECKIRWERELLRMINTSPWSAAEDAVIKRMREEGKNWNKVIHQLPGRDKGAIIRRCKELGCGIKNYGKWTEEEMEALLIAVIPYEGKKDWKKIAEQVPSKTVKQCQSRLY